MNLSLILKYKFFLISSIYFVIPYIEFINFLQSSLKFWKPLSFIALLELKLSSLIIENFPLPDFKALNGNADVTLSVKRFPSQAESSSTNSPFTINSSTTKKDTRARGRYVNVKIQNTAANESWRYGTLMLDVKPDGAR